MPANGSNLTVRTDQKLDVAHVLGEAHVLKDEHVVNQPVLLEEITVGIAAISQGWLLSHGGEEKLRWEREHKACESRTGSCHICSWSSALDLDAQQLTELGGNKRTAVTTVGHALG